MKYILLGMIRIYQKILSPLKMSSTCRFCPTCSQYALESIKRHGAIKGLYLSIGRILRCNPYNRGGFDYVPKKFSLRYLFCRNDDTSEKDIYKE